MREVQLPLALPSIMVGVNQVIMLSLSMVVIAGLVGAAGLGAVVVCAVTQLDIAPGFESGLAVVYPGGHSRSPPRQLSASAVPVCAEGVHRNARESAMRDSCFAL